MFCNSWGRCRSKRRNKRRKQEAFSIDVAKERGKTERVEIPLNTLLGEEWDVSREMILAIWHDKGWSLRPWTKKHWDRLQAFFLDASRTTHPRRLDLPGKIRLLVRRGNVYFERITDS